MIIVPACALIDTEDRIYITQRHLHVPQGGLWEFPGGKVESGEAVTDALIRELKEETGIDVTHSCLSPLTFAIEDSNPKENIIVLLYACRVWKNSPKALQAIQGKWVHVNKLREYDMPQCNKAMIAILRDLLMY